MAPLQKPEILKAVPQNDQQFCSLDTARNTSLALCTKNVGLRPWIMSGFVVPACLSKLNAHIVSIFSVIKQHWQR